MPGRALQISLMLMLLMSTSSTARATDARMRITSLCLAGFNAAMASAGKTPPAGMGDFTCDCFLKEVNSDSSIEWATLLGSIQSAQQTCKQRAAERFKI